MNGQYRDWACNLSFILWPTELTSGPVQRQRRSTSRSVQLILICKAGHDSPFLSTWERALIYNQPYAVLLSSDNFSHLCILQISYCVVSNQCLSSQLFPSPAPKIQMLLRDLYRMVDPMRRLSSVLAVHWLLSSVLQQFQFMNKEAHTNLSEW